MAITKQMVKTHWPAIKAFMKENKVTAFHYRGISVAVMITPTMLHFAFAAASAKDYHNLKPKFGMKIAAYRLWDATAMVTIPNAAKHEEDVLLEYYDSRFNNDLPFGAIGEIMNSLVRLAYFE